MVLLLLATLVSVVLSLPATQVRITFSPKENELIAGFTSMGSNPSGLPLVQSGSSASALNTTTQGSSVAFNNDQCPGNSTRTSHAVPFPAPAGSDVFYRVSADSGASWSAVYEAHNPARAYPATVALWGDMGVECGGVLPPSPGFAGGQCTAVPQLTVDSAAGRHNYSILFGDSSYNMDDRCGGKGDFFLDSVSSFSAHRPHVYTNG